MSAFLDFISNNALVSTLVAAAILAAIGGIWRWHHNRRDRNAIYEFFVKSDQEMPYLFRKTAAIASHTKRSKERVAALCTQDPRIRRNELEEESWTLEAKGKSQGKETKNSK